MEGTFDPISLGATPVQPEAFDPIKLGAKPAPADTFDPIKLGAKQDRTVKLKELTQKLSDPNTPDTDRAVLEDEYVKENEAYRNERGFLGRVKDWYAQTDFKGAAASLGKTLNNLNPYELSKRATMSAAEDLASQGKTEADVTAGDIIKAGAKAANRQAAAATTGLIAGGGDAIQGTASILAKGLAEASDAFGQEDYAAALDLERINQAATKEKGVRAINESLGLGGEQEAAAFEGGRLVGGVAMPVGIPGAGKVLSKFNKAAEVGGDLLAAGAKRAAGTALRGIGLGTEVAADAGTAITGAAVSNIPYIGTVAGGAIAASPIISETGLLGLSKYVKAVKDTIQDTAIQVGKVGDNPITLTPGAALKKLNIAEKVGDWMDDVKTKLSSKPKGAGELLQLSKAGQSIVADAEAVGTKLAAAQDDVISKLTTELASPEISSFQKSLTTSRLHAAEARKASILAGVDVVKKLGTAEKITDNAAKALASATLGATAGTALAAASSTPGDNSNPAEGMLGGAFFGLLLSNLGRAAIKNMPDDAPATAKDPFPKQYRDNVVFDSETFSNDVTQNTHDIIKNPAPGIEVVETPAATTALTPEIAPAPVVPEAPLSKKPLSGLQLEMEANLTSPSPVLDIYRRRLEKLSKELTAAKAELDTYQPTSAKDTTSTDMQANVDKLEAELNRQAIEVKRLEEYQIEREKRLAKKPLAEASK